MPKKQKVRPIDYANPDDDAGQLTTKSDTPIGSTPHERADVRMLLRAIVQGWVSDPEDLRWCYTVLKHVAVKGKNERARVNAAVGAASIMQRAVELGIRLTEVDDKIERLDSGKPTESQDVTIEVVMPSPRERID